jgi:glycine oxidase
VVVVGGGVIGLAVSWRAAAAGLSVVACDDAFGHGASWAAAGMLAPVTEAHAGEELLLALNLASARRWPAFAAAVADATGIDPRMRTDGTVVVGLDDDDLRALDDLARLQASLGLESQRLGARACRDLEPLLHPRVRGGLFVPGDHQVDNRALVESLLAACEKASVCLRHERAVAVRVVRGTVRGVRLAGGQQIDAPRVVVAAGCGSGALGGLPPEALPPIRPVKGQILRLRVDEPLSRCTIRGLARGRAVYLVPRRDGELVVGATAEERGFDLDVTAGAVHELLRAAIDLVPGVREAVLVEARAGLRPATPDNGPVLGAGPLDGLVLATGHFRNGILLTPVTADAITAVLTGGELPPVAAPFTFERFA